MIYINPYLSVPINTIIGGVAGTISTKAALATKLGISESIITRFEIVGSDVHCRISSEYSLKIGSFGNDTNISSFIDIEGKCVVLGAFAFQDSTVVNVFAKNAIINSSCFINANNLSNINYDGEYTYLPTYTVGGISNTKIKKFNAPNITTIPSEFARGNTFLEEITSTLTAVAFHGFNGCTNLDVINTSAITSLGASSMTNCKLSGARLFDSLTEIIGGVNGWKSTSLTFPILENIASKTSQLQNLTNLTLFSMRKLKVLGNPSLVSNCFSGLKTGCKIEVNIALATANSGAADAALVWAKTNRAAVVEFYDDAGNYVSTL